MELSVYNIAGKETGRKVELNEAIFGVEPNEHAIYLDVKQYLANQRQGTHKSKERADISGSTAKLKKQKGTGTARCGSIKSPIFRGGGRVFGPRPRNYTFKLNKKLKLVARKSALAIKATDNKIQIVEDFNLDTPKTKAFVQIMNDMNMATERRLLLVLSESNENVVLSSRNLQNVDVVRVNDLSTYAIMKATTLMFVESSVEGLDEMFTLN